MNSYRIASQDFSALFQNSLPNEKILISEISFKKNEDLLKTLEKSLLQDNISSIYSKDFDDLLLDINLNLKNENYSNYIETHLSNEKNLEKSKSFWVEKVKKLQSSNFKNIDFLTKFIKICSDKIFHPEILSFFKEINKSDNEFIENYNKEQQKQINNHGEEIKNACSQGEKQNEIENLVSKHMQRINEIEKIYKLQFFNKNSRHKEQFIEIINKNYLKFNRNIEIIEKTNIEKQIKINKKKEFKLNLCLGGQKKYFFEIILKDSLLKEIFFFKENDYENLLVKSENEIKNFIFGINKKACLNFIHFNKKTINSNQINELIKFRSDLFFNLFENQIEEILNQINRNPLNEDVFITKHANFKINIIFSIFYESLFDFNNDNELKFIRKIVKLCNSNQIKEIIIPLEIFLKETNYNKIPIKIYGELLMKFLKAFKREITNLAYEYPSHHFLKKITFIIPKENDIQSNIFERSKEILRNCFE